MKAAKLCPALSLTQKRVPQSRSQGRMTARFQRHSKLSDAALVPPSGATTCEGTVIWEPSPQREYAYPRGCHNYQMVLLATQTAAAKATTAILTPACNTSPPTIFDRQGAIKRRRTSWTYCGNFCLRQRLQRRATD